VGLVGLVGLVSRLEAEAAEPKQREGNRGPSAAPKLDTPETSIQAPDKKLMSAQFHEKIKVQKTGERVIDSGQQTCIVP